MTNNFYFYHSNKVELRFLSVSSFKFYQTPILIKLMKWKPRLTLSVRSKFFYLQNFHERIKFTEQKKILWIFNKSVQKIIQTWCETWTKYWFSSILLLLFASSLRGSFRFWIYMKKCATDVYVKNGAQHTFINTLSS